MAKKYKENLSECSICSEKKYIGFTHYEKQKSYRLCEQHYNEWTFAHNTLEIDKYINLARSKDEGQVKLQ